VREDWIFVDRPQLGLFLNYRFLTAGEADNILIRLQACVRSLERLGPRGYVSKLQGEPRFVVSSFYTKGSAEIALAIAGLALAVTQLLWYDFAKLAWRRLIATVYFFLKGELPGQREPGLPPDEFEMKLLRGAEDDLRLVVNLNELDEQQRRKLADFVYSIVYPTDSVRLNDDQTELVIVRVRRK